jgi:hypothetical protein
MSLNKTYVRDGNRRIIASVTSGFFDETEIVRDGENQVIGKVNHRFENTRDARGNLVSVDTADPGLLIGRRK